MRQGAVPPAALPAPSPASVTASLPALASGRRRLWLAGVLGNHLLQAALALAVAVAARALTVQIGAAHVDAPHANAPGAGGVAFALGDAAAWVALLMLLLAGAALLRGLELTQGEALAQHYIAHLRLRLFDGLVQMAPAGRHRRSRGGVMLRFVGDVQAMRTWVGRGIAQCVAAACALAVLLGALAWWHAPLALLALTWLLLACGAMALTLPPVVRAVRLARRRQAGIAANIHDRIGTLPLLQGSGSARRERQRLHAQNRGLRRAMQQRAWARARHRWAVDLCIGGLGLTLLAVLSGSLPAAAGTWLGLAAVPDTGLLVGAVTLLALLARPLRSAAVALESLAAARVARERMLDFLREPARLAPARHGASPGAAPTLAFDAAGVRGRLVPFTAALPHGRHVAVTGAAGSGKSTLLALAARLLDPDSGRVCLGGRGLVTLDGPALRRALGVLAAEPLLVRGTVRQNLQQRRPNAAEHTLAAAAALTGWVDAGPALFAQTVSDAGANLNGELRREIAWAAALVGQPAVLLIDDAERALPGQPAARLQAFLRRYPGSVLFSTADPGLAALADEVWALPAAPLERPTDSPASPVPAAAGKRLRLVATD